MNTSSQQTSRAVLRFVTAGNHTVCPGCDSVVKFQARLSDQNLQVICNVYAGGTWLRTEHWHTACYEEAHEPHGPVDKTKTTRR